MRLKRCATHGIYSDNEKRCPKCKQDSHKIYDKTSRNKDSAKFYNSKEWKLTRDRAAKRDGGLCQECLRNGDVTEFDVVDHIIEIEDGGCKLCVDNLECLCHSCHNRKSAEKRKDRGLVMYRMKV